MLVSCSRPTLIHVHLYVTSLLYAVFLPVGLEKLTSGLQSTGHSVMVAAIIVFTAAPLMVEHGKAIGR